MSEDHRLFRLRRAYPFLSMMTLILSALNANAECLAPVGTAKVTAATRRDCLAQTQIILEQAPALSLQAIEQGYGEKTDSIQNTSVWCVFTPHHKATGDTSKFRCHRTNEDFKSFLNKKGDSVLEAANVDADGDLINDAGEKIAEPGNPNKPNKQVKFQEADKVKIKYSLGDPRDREVFTEIAVSRIFWALGIPADRMYPVSVKCKGCEKKDYEVASLERKFKGKEIELKPDQGWEFKEILPLYQKWKANKDPRALHIETLILAANLVTYHNGAGFQNRLICTDHDKETGLCHQSMIHIHDLGSSLAGPREPGQPMNPRGDFKVWSKQTVFRDAKTCQPRYSLGFGDTFKISEKARQLLAERLQKLVQNPDQVRAIFRVARFDKADPGLVKEIKSKLQTGENLSEKTIEAWSSKFMKMADEILSARCPQ